MVREASILVRGRNGDADCTAGVLEEGLAGSGDVAGGTESVAERSEATVCDREPIGTIKFGRFGSDAWGDSDERGAAGSSSGISSAAGMGRPLPAATN